MLDFGSMLYRIPALLFAITVHEYAHAIAADEEGDPTPRLMGRLTLNPFAHLDPIGALLLVVAGFGWAKPVMINERNFRNPSTGIMKVSFAGPAANLFLTFAAALMWAVLGKLNVHDRGVYQFLFWIQMYNVWFAFFNLLPIPPLDGSKILAELLPPKLAWQYMSFSSQYSMVLLVVIVFSGLSSKFINPLAQAYMLLVHNILRIIF